MANSKMTRPKISRHGDEKRLCWSEEIVNGVRVFVDKTFPRFMREKQEPKYLNAFDEGTKHGPRRRSAQ